MRFSSKMFEFFSFLLLSVHKVLCYNLEVAMVVQWNKFPTFVECSWMQPEICHFYLWKFVYMKRKDKINEQNVKTSYKMYWSCRMFSLWVRPLKMHYRPQINCSSVMTVTSSIRTIMGQTSYLWLYSLFFFI